MRPAMYLFLNRSLGMSPGKASAQVAHAAVEAYRISYNSTQGVGEHNRKAELIESWYLGNHYTKLVMLAEDDLHLFTIQKYIEDRGFQTNLIIDEGRTEIRPHSPTALGVEVVDRDDPHTAATFGDFKLYKEDESKTPWSVMDGAKYTEPYNSGKISRRIKRPRKVPPRWPI